MADAYPFISYPFSEPVTPEQARLAQPAPPAQPAQPVNPWVPPPPSSADIDDDEIAHKPALATKVAPTMTRRGINCLASLRLGLVAEILVFLALAGLGAWYFLSDGEEQDQNLIFASVGGAVTTPEGAAVMIPPGALPQDTRVEIAKVSDGEVTDLFALKPLGLEFLKPVTVEIPYKKSGPIVLEYWREGEEKKVLRYTVDRKEKKLKAEIKAL